MNYARIKDLVIVVLIAILVPYVALNATDKTKMWMQNTINRMSSEAFEAWLEEMKSIESIFKNATTNADLAKAVNYTFAAMKFAYLRDMTIQMPRPPNFTNHLYSKIMYATYRIDGLVSNCFKEVNRGSAYKFQNASLQSIANITNSIKNLVDTVGPVTWDVDPVQQLKERGILEQIITYCTQLEYG